MRFSRTGRPLASFPALGVLLLLLLSATLFSITGVLLAGGRLNWISRESKGDKGENRGFVGHEEVDNGNNASHHKIFLETNRKGREREEREGSGEALNGATEVNEVDGVEGVGGGGQIEEEGWGHKNNLEEGGLPLDFYMGEDEDDKHTVDEDEWKAEMVGEVGMKEEGEGVSEPYKGLDKGTEIGKRGKVKNVQESIKSLDEKREIDEKGEAENIRELAKVLDKRKDLGQTGEVEKAQGADKILGESGETSIKGDGKMGKELEKRSSKSSREDLTEKKNRKISRGHERVRRRKNGRSGSLQDIRERRMNLFLKKKHMYGYGSEFVDENNKEPEEDDKGDAEKTAFLKEKGRAKSWLDQFRNQILQGKNVGKSEEWDKLKSVLTNEVEPKKNVQIQSGNSSEREKFLKEWKEKEGWPPDNELLREMESWNILVSKNMEKFPQGGVGEGKVIIVLYVHNRPEYLKIVLESLAKVSGISETLLIVSHDGFYPEMDNLVKSISFCQVKQIYAPYSPHNFQSSFPGPSPDDCSNDSNNTVNCTGQTDHFGHFRSPKFTSLKHHWWWMMNTVWDGLYETREFNDHILFIEEDHYVLPNAYRTVQALIKIKNEKCGDCIGVNLAPSNVRIHTNGGPPNRVVAEKMGNIGYAFNRTVWEMIHKTAEDFCRFDDYNWDMTYWSAVQRHWGANKYSLRATRASAWHIGTYGLHAKHRRRGDLRRDLPVIKRVDLTPYIGNNPTVTRVALRLPAANFVGYGGWGDWRDQEMCRYFAEMYRGK